MTIRVPRASELGGAGQFNSRIILQEKTDSQDEDGSPIETWPTAPTGTTIWASVLPESSEEFQTALKQHAKLAVLFKTRFRLINPATQRIAWRESTEAAFRYFDIATPMVVGLQEGLLIPAIAID